MTEEYQRLYDAVLAQWTVPVESLDVETPFGVTRVHAAGPADADPVVLLPGGGATSAVWFAVGSALAQTRRVYAVDLISDVGRTRPVAGAVRTRQDVTAWLEATLDGLGVERADVVGHSYGAWIALAATLDTKRARRLALLDPTTSFAGFRFGYLWHSLPVITKATPRRWRRFLAWETGGRPIDAASRELLAHSAQAENGARLVMPKRFAAQELRALESPTLVVLAGKSKAHDVRKVGAGATRLLRKVTVRTLPEASHHTLPTEDAAVATAMLEEFLGS
ncbi:MAG: alpha/beta fold hydrolase [Hamadaea sp.]|nr:alpha/beta fold hydrolase [Hamadaea sp.]